MWKSGFFPRDSTKNYTQPIVNKYELVNKGKTKKKKKKFSPEKELTIHNSCGKISEAGVNICGNIPNVVLKRCVVGFQSGFNFINGVQDRGMIAAKFLADIRCAEVCQLTDQVDSHLPGFVRYFIFQRTADDTFFNGEEFTHLIDDQRRCGQGVAGLLEHIGNGPGNIRKIQGHIV